ncbi:MAG: YqaJ viral recombinase family protein [Phycicoccus sp.]|nr:YqaJ viral recombinase family protein [Phycicoccus sp.]
MTPTPGSPEWLSKVTASKVAAILGLSPWDSPLTLWHKMRGDLAPEAQTDYQARGHFLEDGVLRWWLAERPDARSIVDTQPYRSLEDWAGATPDAIAYDGDDVVLVDAKTDAREYDWIEPPVWYVASSLWQLACFPDAQRVHLAVLHAGLRFREYVIERDEETIADVVAACRRFYDSLAADEAPPLSGMAAEYDVLRRVTVGIDKGESVDLPADLADAYLSDLAHEKRCAATKARILDAMGHAQYAYAGGVKIARRQPAKDGIALVRVAALPDLTETETAA